jgi:hypothetical protein
MKKAPLKKGNLMTSSRKLQYADRVALQQADQAIRKDVLRALVEVITNCNDSYSRLEHTGQRVKGEIVIDIHRKHQKFHDTRPRLCRGYD